MRLRRPPSATPPLPAHPALRPAYPRARDRPHTFNLESGVDPQQDFERRGIQDAFHLERKRWSKSKDEAASAQKKASPHVDRVPPAAPVVTDAVAACIKPRHTQRRREQLSAVDGPGIVAVESCTVVPMTTFTEEFSSARAFRPRILEALPHHLHPVENPAPESTRRIDLPFEPTILSSESIPALVASCPIDHSVPPSPLFKGGMKAAHARLAGFLEHGIERYSTERNDPNLDASSGLSPYLHFGNISMQLWLLKTRKIPPPKDWEN